MVAQPLDDDASSVRRRNLWRCRATFSAGVHTNASLPAPACHSPHPRPGPHPVGITQPMAPREAVSTRPVEENIRSIADLELSMSSSRGVLDRVADAIGTFTGSFGFVLVHAVWFAVWFAWNTHLLHYKPFDPYPFILLAMVVSVEGVLLSTFVLMKQNRMQQRSDLRHQLDLQINLLTEKEMTKALQLLQRVARRLEVDTADDPELDEMAQTTSVDSLGQRIRTELGSFE